MRSAKCAINEGLETDILNGMRVEEGQYAKVSLQITLHNNSAPCNLTANAIVDDSQLIMSNSD